MHLAVDHAGQHIQPGGIDPARGIGKAAQADDLAIAHRHIKLLRPAGV
jgi:hypothetical protein